MIWMTEGEENLFELYELLTEARDQVDQKYPRKRNIQSDAIVERFGMGRWLDAHDVWFELRKELDV